MHFLGMRIHSVNMLNTDEGGFKHTLPRDKEANACVSIVNMDEGGQNHTLPRDQEPKCGVSIVNTDEGG